MIGQRMGRRWGGGAVALIVVIVAAALAPAGASAEVEERSFLKLGALFASGDANATVGPANEYPSQIVVPPTPGLVTKATVTLFGLGSGRPEDIDMALVGPDGNAVMLMSDACGNDTHALAGNTWTFEDAAPTFLSQIGCVKGQTASFKPTNYFEEEHPDQLEVRPGEGAPGPYGNELAAFDGIAPSGAWSLYVLDDTAGVVGFNIGGWALALQVEPPPPTTIPPVTTPPVTPPATGGGGGTVTAPPAPPAPKAKPKPTGRRAAALAKCKKKKAGKPRLRCRARAHKLPA